MTPSFCYFCNFYLKMVLLCCLLMHFMFLIHSFILMFKKQSIVPKCRVCAYMLKLQLSIFLLFLSTGPIALRNLGPCSQLLTVPHMYNTCQEETGSYA